MREAMKKVSPKTPLLGYFVGNAQRRSFDPFFLRRKPPYPLRRDVADPALLQQAFIVWPARFVRESKRNVVKLPHDYHYQHEFLEASRKIQKLRLPQKFRICK